MRETRDKTGARDKIGHKRQDVVREMRNGGRETREETRHKRQEMRWGRERREMGMETTHLCVHRCLSLSEGPETWAGGSEVSRDWAPEAQSYSLGDTPSN